MKSMVKQLARNAPIYSLAALAMLTTEWLTAALLWRYEPDHVVGVTYSVLTAGMSLLGLVVSGSAAMLKADPRRHVAGRAFAARIVSVLLVLPTTVVGGGAMALKLQQRAAQEYAASQEYAADLRNANDDTMDSQAKLQSAANLSRATLPMQARVDEAYIASVLAFLALCLLPIAAVGAGRVFAPETEAQAKRRAAQERAAKAARTKRQNAKQRTAPKLYAVK